MQVNKMDHERYFTYILRCADESLYCGWTTNLEKRVDAHNGLVTGGAKYTKGRRPVTLVYYESFRQKQEAQSREYAIKRLNKAQKLRLIASATMDTLENINLSE
jgi:GIY-YIG catalytic domain protein